MSDLGAYALRFALLIAVAGFAAGVRGGIARDDAWTRVSERAVTARDHGLDAIGGQPERRGNLGRIERAHPPAGPGADVEPAASAGEGGNEHVDCLLDDVEDLDDLDDIEEVEDLDGVEGIEEVTDDDDIVFDDLDDDIPELGGGDSAFAASPAPAPPRRRPTPA